MHTNLSHRPQTSYLSQDILNTGCIHWRCQLWGTEARAPLDFQLFNFSGHFRATQTLTFDSMWLPIQQKLLSVSCPHRTKSCQRHGYACTGRAKKSNPLGKIRYLWNCSKFFRQIYSIFRGGFRPHILQISLQYLVAFKNYNYFNLNVHFSK